MAKGNQHTNQDTSKGKAPAPAVSNSVTSDGTRGERLTTSASRPLSIGMQLRHNRLPLLSSRGSIKSIDGNGRVLSLSKRYRYGAIGKVRVHAVLVERTAWSALLSGALLLHSLLRLVTFKVYEQVDIIVWWTTIVSVILECCSIMLFMAILFINYDKMSGIWKKRLHIITNFLSFICVAIFICETSIAFLVYDVFGTKSNLKSSNECL